MGSLWATNRVSQPHDIMSGFFFKCNPICLSQTAANEIILAPQNWLQDLQDFRRYSLGYTWWFLVFYIFSTQPPYWTKIICGSQIPSFSSQIPILSQTKPLKPPYGFPTSLEFPSLKPQVVKFHGIEADLQGARTWIAENVVGEFSWIWEVKYVDCST